MLPDSMALGVVLGIVGVPVTVTGPYDVMPMTPDSAHPEVVWPTSRVALYTSVLMDNGIRWVVTRVPRRLADGSVQVTLTAPGSPSSSTITVPRDFVDTPIWWVDEVAPEPPPPPGPPTEDPGEPENPPNPG